MEIPYNPAKGMHVADAIEQNRDILKFVSKEIWSHPELSSEEYFAHDLLSDVLEKFGFKVSKKYLLPTAFRAEFSSGRAGPTVAVMCEYDALPNIGHACGHNLIAEVALATGIAVKTAIENDSSVGGKVVVLGTPDEEMGGGKIQLIEKGAFKDIDVAMMAHPQMINILFPFIVECSEFSAVFQVKNDHSECDYDVWENLNAMDAAVTCYNNITVLRHCFKPNWRVSVIIPRSSVKETTVRISFRAPFREELLTINKLLNQCVLSASEVTNCTYRIEKKEYEEYSAYCSMIHNKTIANVFQKHVGLKGIHFQDDNPTVCKAAVSTDMGNVSHVVPSIHPEFSIGASPPHMNHTPGFAEAANTDAAQSASLAVAEGLAMTAVQLMSDPQLMDAVKREFEDDPHRVSSEPLREPGV